MTSGTTRTTRVRVPGRTVRCQRPVVVSGPDDDDSGGTTIPGRDGNCEYRGHTGVVKRIKKPVEEVTIPNLNTGVV